MLTWVPIAAAALIALGVVLWVIFAARVAHELDQIIEEIDRHKR